MNPGVVLQGRYEVVRRVASGGSAVVHQGRDRETGCDVAIKVLSQTSQSGVDRFRREAEVLATLDHPHIARFMSFGWDEQDRPYLIQEWVPGPTLADQLYRGMAIRASVDMARHVASALGAAHRLGVIHRDVKPSNILHADDLWRIVDFGIARVIGDEIRLTHSGSIVGTLGYMSPEQARPEPTIDARADVFSLGCVLYEALSGRRAFAGRTPLAIRAKILFADPVPLDSLNPRLPGPLVALVAGMMCREPASRPADGDEVCRRLSQVDDADLADTAAVRVSTEDTATRTLSSSSNPDSLIALVLSAPIAHLDGLESARARLRARLGGFAGPGDVLHDGAVIYRAAGERPAAIARDAARAALAISAEIPTVPIVITSAGRPSEIAASLESAATVVRAGTFDQIFAAISGHTRSRLRVDPVTASLLGPEFTVVNEGDDFWLLAGPAI